MRGRGDYHIFVQLLHAPPYSVPFTLGSCTSSSGLPCPNLRHWHRGILWWFVRHVSCQPPTGLCATATAFSFVFAFVVTGRRECGVHHIGQAQVRAGEMARCCPQVRANAWLLNFCYTTFNSIKPHRFITCACLVLDMGWGGVAQRRGQVTPVTGSRTLRVELIESRQSQAQRWHFYHCGGAA